MFECLNLLCKCSGVQVFRSSGVTSEQARSATEPLNLLNPLNPLNL